MQEWLNKCSYLLTTVQRFFKKKWRKIPEHALSPDDGRLYIPDSFIREFATPRRNYQASLLWIWKTGFLIKKRERRRNRCERHLLRSCKTSHNSDEPERILTEKSPHLHYYTFWLLWCFEQSPKTKKKKMETHGGEWSVRSPGLQGFSLKCN